MWATDAAPFSCYHLHSMPRTKFYAADDVSMFIGIYVYWLFDWTIAFLARQFCRWCPLQTCPKIRSLSFLTFIVMASHSSFVSLYLPLSLSLSFSLLSEIVQQFGVVWMQFVLSKRRVALISLFYVYVGEAILLVRQRWRSWQCSVHRLCIKYFLVYRFIGIKHSASAGAWVFSNANAARLCNGRRAWLSKMSFYEILIYNYLLLSIHCTSIFLFFFCFPI